MPGKRQKTVEVPVVTQAEVEAAKKGLEDATIKKGKFKHDVLLGTDWKE